MGGEGGELLVEEGEGEDGGGEERLREGVGDRVLEQGGRERWARG